MRLKTMDENGGKWDRGPWIMMASGRQFFPIDPRPEDVHIEDMAHSLARLCRYNGHVKCDHYSVAQHSVIISRLVPPEDALAGLLHDGPEYVIGDLARPIKPFVSGWDEIDMRIHNAICDRFGIPYEIPKSIKAADWDLLLLEMELFLPQWPGDFDPLYTRSSLSGFPIEPMGAKEAEEAFLDRFAELSESAKEKDEVSEGSEVGEAVPRQATTGIERSHGGTKGRISL